jgi:hypothetical protein
MLLAVNDKITGFCETLEPYRSRDDQDRNEGVGPKAAIGCIGEFDSHALTAFAPVSR